MKNLLILSLAALVLAACSSAPTQRTVNFPDGSSTLLPSNWDVVPGDDTMPNSVLALGPAENGYRPQFRVDVRKPFKGMDKVEIISKLKDSLEGRGALLGEPRLGEISGEPAVAYAWKGRESGTDNPLMTADITHFGYFVCDDSNIYSLDFSTLTSQAAEVKASVVDSAVSSFRTAAALKKEREAQLKAQEEFEAREREQKAAKAAKAQKEEAFGEEDAFAAAEKEAAEIEKEVEKELEEEKFQAEAAPEDNGRAAAQKRVEAARKAAQEAQEAAQASARAAKAAAREAQEKAAALSAAQMELDSLNEEGFVQIQEREVVVEKEAPAVPAQPVESVQPAQPATPTFSIENKVTVTPQSQQVMEVQVTAPQQTAPAAPAQPAAPAAPQTSPIKKSNGQLVIEMQTVN